VKWLSKKKKADLPPRLFWIFDIQIIDNDMKIRLKELNNK